MGMTRLVPGSDQSGSMPRPSREFAPAGDLLFGRPKSRQKVAPVPSPLRCAPGFPALLGVRGRAQLASFAALTTLRQRGAKSEVEACCARAPNPCDARLLQRGVKEQPNSQQPNAESLRSRLFLLSPLEPAEQRKDLRACAQRTSTSDSAQLFDRSVAEGVLRGPSRPEQRREARRAGRVGGRLLPTFGRSKVGRPPGRTPGMGLAINTDQRTSSPHPARRSH